MTGDSFNEGCSPAKRPRISSTPDRHNGISNHHRNTSTSNTTPSQLSSSSTSDPWGVPSCSGLQLQEHEAVNLWENDIAQLKALFPTVDEEILKSYLQVYDLDVCIHVVSTFIAGYEDGLDDCSILNESNRFEYLDNITHPEHPERSLSSNSSFNTSLSNGSSKKGKSPAKSSSVSPQFDTQSPTSFRYSTSLDSNRHSHESAREDEPDETETSSCSSNTSILNTSINSQATNGTKPSKSKRRNNTHKSSERKKSKSSYEDILARIAAVKSGKPIEEPQPTDTPTTASSKKKNSKSKLSSSGKVSKSSISQADRDGNSSSTKSSHSSISMEDDNGADDYHPCEQTDIPTCSAETASNMNNITASLSAAKDACTAQFTRESIAAAIARARKSVPLPDDSSTGPTAGLPGHENASKPSVNKDFAAAVLQRLVSMKSKYSTNTTAQPSIAKNVNTENASQHGTETKSSNNVPMQPFVTKNVKIEIASHCGTEAKASVNATAQPSDTSNAKIELTNVEEVDENTTNVASPATGNSSVIANTSTPLLTSDSIASAIEQAMVSSSSTVTKSTTISTTSTPSFTAITSVIQLTTTTTTTLSDSSVNESPASNTSMTTFTKDSIATAFQKARSKLLPAPANSATTGINWQSLKLPFDKGSGCAQTAGTQQLNIKPPTVNTESVQADVIKVEQDSKLPDENPKPLSQTSPGLYKSTAAETIKSTEIKKKNLEEEFNSDTKMSPTTNSVESAQAKHVEVEKKDSEMETNVITSGSDNSIPESRTDHVSSESSMTSSSNTSTPKVTQNEKDEASNQNKQAKSSSFSSSLHVVPTLVLKPVKKDSDSTNLDRCSTPKASPINSSSGNTTFISRTTLRLRAVKKESDTVSQESKINSKDDHSTQVNKEKIDNDSSKRAKYLKGLSALSTRTEQLRKSSGSSPSTEVSSVSQQSTNAISTTTALSTSSLQQSTISSSAKESSRSQQPSNTATPTKPLEANSISSIGQRAQLCNDTKPLITRAKKGNNSPCEISNKTVSYRNNHDLRSKRLQYFVIDDSDASDNSLQRNDQPPAQSICQSSVLSNSETISQSHPQSKRQSTNQPKQSSASKSPQPKRQSTRQSNPIPGTVGIDIRCGNNKSHSSMKKCYDRSAARKDIASPYSRKSTPKHAGVSISTTSFTFTPTTSTTQSSSSTTNATSTSSSIFSSSTVTFNYQPTANRCVSQPTVSTSKPAVLNLTGVQQNSMRNSSFATTNSVTFNTVTLTPQNTTTNTTSTSNTTPRSVAATRAPQPTGNAIIKPPTFNFPHQVSPNLVKINIYATSTSSTISSSSTVTFNNKPTANWCVSQPTVDTSKPAALNLTGVQQNSVRNSSFATTTNTTSTSNTTTRSVAATRAPQPTGNAIIKPPTFNFPHQVSPNLVGKSTTKSVAANPPTATTQSSRNFKSTIFTLNLRSNGTSSAPVTQAPGARTSATASSTATNTAQISTSSNLLGNSISTTLNSATFNPVAMTPQSSRNVTTTSSYATNTSMTFAMLQAPMVTSATTNSTAQLRTNGKNNFNRGKGKGPRRAAQSSSPPSSRGQPSTAAGSSQAAANSSGSGEAFVAGFNQSILDSNTELENMLRSVMERNNRLTQLQSEQSNSPAPIQHDAQAEQNMLSLQNETEILAKLFPDFDPNYIFHKLEQHMDDPSRVTKVNEELLKKRENQSKGGGSNKSVRWTWVDKHGNYHQFTDAESNSIEAYFKRQANKQVMIHFKGSSRALQFHFRDMTMMDPSTGRTASLRRVDGNIAASPQKSDNQVQNPAHKPRCLIEVFPGTSEFTRVENLLKKSIPGANVTKIEKIDNTWLQKKYYMQYDLLKQKNGEANVNVKELFHGTRGTKPSMIWDSEDGFDMRYSAIGMWGRGCYFAVNALYSHSYAYTYRKHNSRTIYCQMFLAHVLTGDSADLQPNNSIIKPPLNNQTGRDYDSITGITKGHRIYVLYNNAMSYPAYLITYTV